MDAVELALEFAVEDAQIQMMERQEQQEVIQDVPQAHVKPPVEEVVLLPVDNVSLDAEDPVPMDVLTNVKEDVEINVKEDVQVDHLLICL